MLDRITAAMLPKVLWISLLTMVGWSLLIAASLYRTIEHYHADAIIDATIEARSIFYLNKEYRRWVSDRGGVYVKVTDDFKPNPYLDLPDRDVRTTDGTELTLVNPAYMTRIVFEYVEKNTDPPIISRLVSTKYTNPVNAPDGWEREKLKLFEAGLDEASEVVSINSEPYLRLIAPFFVEEPCLKCHAAQGYKVGDVRGALSIAVPFRLYKEAEAVLINSAAKTSFIIWFIGICIISLYSIGITAATRRKIAQKETRLSSMRQMLVGIAHHWRQPMNRIGLTLQGLEAASEDGDMDSGRLHEDIGRAMAELNAMSGDISIFNTTFRQVGASDAGGVKTTVREVFEPASRMMEENGIELRLSCRAGIAMRPCLDEPLNDDGRMLETVISNLAINSVNAIKDRIESGGLPPGGGLVDIECRLGRKRLRLRMTDNGGGIPDEVIERLFEPYFTTKDKAFHSGIGLFVAKTIVEQYYGGSIMVRNADGSAETVLEVMVGDE